MMPLLFIGGATFFSSTFSIEGELLSDISFLENSGNDVEVVFFGFKECSYICPTSLFTMANALDALKEIDSDLQVGGIFVDVNAASKIERTHEYVSNFSTHIVGVNTSETNLKRLRADFALNIYEVNRSVNDISHTDHFFVLKREHEGWRVAKVLANESDDQILINTIINSLDKSNQN